MSFTKRTNVGGVLNLIDGKAPVINQKYLIDVFDNSKRIQKYSTLYSRAVSFKSKVSLEDRF